MKEGREWGELGNRERERDRRDEIETTTTLVILFSEWENDWERGEERK